MSDDALNYEGLPIWEQIKLLNEWAPLLGFGQRFVAEQDAYRRSLVVADALEWLASKTKAKVDDEFVRLVEGVVRTPQGEELVRWAVSFLEAKP